MIENMMNNKSMPKGVSVIHHKKDTSKNKKKTSWIVQSSKISQGEKRFT